MKLEPKFEVVFSVALIAYHYKDLIIRQMEPNAPLEAQSPR